MFEMEMFVVGVVFVRLADSVVGVRGSVAILIMESGVCWEERE